jgi:hypothetical protein
MILLQGARIASAGLIIGIFAAFGLTRYLATLLFSVSPRRSLHVRDGRPGTRACGLARVLHPHPPRLASRPDDRSALRMKLATRIEPLLSRASLGSRLRLPSRTVAGKRYESNVDRVTLCFVRFGMFLPG